MSDLTIVSASVRNLLAVSHAAKQLSILSDLPKILLRSASESYSFLELNELQCVATGSRHTLDDFARQTHAMTFIYKPKTGNKVPRKVSTQVAFSPFENGTTHLQPKRTGDRNPICSKVVEICDLMPGTDRRPERRHGTLTEVSRDAAASAAMYSSKLRYQHSQMFLLLMLSAMTLFRHLVHRSQIAAEKVLASGIICFIRSIWDFILSEENLFHEVLAFLCNLASASVKGARMIALEGEETSESGWGGQKGSCCSIASRVVSLLERGSICRAPQHQLATSLLRVLVMEATAGQLFLRGRFLSVTCMQELQRGLKMKDWEKVDAVLKILLNASASRNGQRVLMQSLGHPGFLDMELQQIGFQAGGSLEQT
ncbi:hypothetical protein CBR_g50050 [Chara braunii]|uniref:Uncharacterized protein n=1 Tax=Chara braunii TaxID=69332 RepID=A0A388M5Z6_CHABU|nr:hypothetical protein CBR_g50050 [Chara braunii]|eukprot:GBG89960.1 hypothetical protein CBR_g50050 [Chara braunii]